MTKFVFITGGVVSSLGKGVVSASLGQLLSSRGIGVSFLKFDPYLNRDAGTMNPYQHGEVFVTEDGAETDLDLGHYERFAGATLGRRNNVTTGQIYGEVLDRERRGCYGGETVQVIPHVVDTIKAAILRAAEDGPDVLFVELGGTIGDIEGMPFIEAIRQFMLDRPKDGSVLLHLALLPGSPAGGEIKTKPAQHSAQKLRECGLHMDFLLCRSERPMSCGVREKLALYSNLRADRVIDVPDVRLIYEIPDRLHRQGLDDMLCRRLGLESADGDREPWRSFVAAAGNGGVPLRIAAVGKYTGMADSYKSLGEALLHAAAAKNAKLRLDWIGAEDLEAGDPAAILAPYSGVIVPGGFGYRGASGKMRAIRWAREGGTPFLGLCYGLQCAVVEFARNVCGEADAVSAEWLDAAPFDAANSWITLLDNQGKATPLGGTLRLGAQPCALEPGSRAAKAYGAEAVSERHRHRYEVNPEKTALLEERGMRITGRHPPSGLVEIIELPGDQWFVATQAHPEFKSRPLAPHPLFLAFVEAALAQGAPRGA
ncbi:MAG: CTP synthase [Planctomycetota bacterium]|jgi:CTP synthase|nr:CTP synthase [Planctomycetota bacterium]